MNSTLSKVIIFAAGAAIGSAVTWKLVKGKYERVASEEIAEMREYYRKKQESVEVTNESVEPEESIVKIDKVNRAEYENIANRYSGSYKSEEKGGEDDMEDDDKPYVIAPETFGEIDDYDTETLTYYADGVLEDDQGHVIEDPDDLVGKDFADHFGEYEDDAVHVRNDKYHTYYEILQDTRTYEEATSFNSHKDDE